MHVDPLLLTPLPSQLHTTMSSGPSPSKKMSLPPSAIPQPDPLDARGSFARQASSRLGENLEDMVREASTRGRMGESLFCSG